MSARIDAEAFDKARISQAVRDFNAALVSGMSMSGWAFPPPSAQALRDALAAAAPAPPYLSASARTIMVPAGDHEIPVRIIPGITTLTPMGASLACKSARSTSDSASTPCFETAYGPSRAGAYTAAIDAVLTTCPSSPDARISGTKVRTPWMTPHRLISSTRCQSSRVSSQALPVTTTPALLTATFN